MKELVKNNSNQPQKQITLAGSQVSVNLPSHLQPLPPPKQSKEVEEDQFVEDVSKIIKRDFFPDLDLLRLKKEQLNALELNDLVRASRLQAEIERIGKGIKELDAEKKLSLDQYLSKHTSEDNKSFTDLMEIENKQKRDNYSYFYEGELKQIEYTDRKVIGNESKPINTWQYSAKSALMYGAPEAPMTLADFPVTRGGSKEILHQSTRLESDLNLLDSKIDSTTFKRLETEQIWKEIGKTPAMKRNETPMVAGFKMVPNTPDLVPGVDIDPSELITWGMIESTPLLTSGKTPSFSIAPTPKREQLSHKLSDMATKSIKNRQSSGVSKTTRSASPALNMLAKKLIGRPLTGSTSALRNSYTPTPGRKIVTPMGSGNFTPMTKKPESMPISKEFKAPNNTGNTTNHSNITDGLMKD